MKKLLLLLALVPSAVFGVGIADTVNKFLTMEKQHKQDWLDNKQKHFDKKITMIKKHVDQWFELKEKYVTEFGKGMAANAVLADELKDMVKLHSAQTKEWANLCKDNMKMNEATAKKHHDQLKAFETEAKLEESKTK